MGKVAHKVASLYARVPMCTPACHGVLSEPAIHRASFGRPFMAALPSAFSRECECDPDVYNSPYSRNGFTGAVLHFGVIEVD